MNFRNILAIALDVIIIPSLWIVKGLGVIDIPSEALGASIVVWTLIAQFYFRKKETS